MGCTKFYYNNLVLDAVLNPSTENAQFPVENLQHAFRTKVYRSTTNSDHIYFDFGAAEPIDSFVAVPHIIDGFGFTTASLELNNVATWVGSPLATIPITIDTVNGIASGSIGTPVNARYAKLILTSTLGYCEVSKIFIGEVSEIGSENDFQYPLDFDQDDFSNITRNRYRQKFIDTLPTQKKFKGSINTMTNDEVELVRDLNVVCSKRKPFFIRFENVNIFNEPNIINGYYYLVDNPSFKYVAGGFWDATLALEEGM